jgi:CBS-domain-containing membrane protein
MMNGTGKRRQFIPQAAQHQVRRLPVLNRDKRLVGVVALADLGRSEQEPAKEALKGISEPTDKERR